MLIKKNCLFCQKEFTRELSPDNLKRGKGKYCSALCGQKDYSKRYKEGKIKANLKGLELGRLGNSHSLETRKKISDSLRGKTGKLARNWGNAHSEMTREVLSKKQRKNWQNPVYAKAMGVAFSKFAKKQWKNKEFREKKLELMLKGLIKRPTRFEQQVINLIDKHQLPYKYTGNGIFWIEGKNPDFIHIGDQKKLIEVGNLYHHIKRFGSIENYINQRKEHYQKYGWTAFFFMGDKLDEIEILRTLTLPSLV